MRVTFNKTGAERKALVTAIGEILKTKPTYKGMPGAAYEIAGLTVDKEGTIEFEDCIYPKDIEELLENLANKGFVPTQMYEETKAVPESENIGFTVQIPIDKVEVHNLTNLIDAKGHLIKKALGIDDIQIDVQEEWVEFPWFNTITSDEAQTYAKFISELCRMSKAQKRVNVIEKPISNEKYAFRCFLLRLGFIGPEYKEDRKILLRNLSGSSAFKNGGTKS